MWGDFMKKINNLPLQVMCRVLVNNKIFPHQTIAYRTLVVLSAYEIKINNKKQKYTTDDLIVQIQEYLREGENNIDTKKYHVLHSTIGNILINGGFELSDKVESREDMLSLSGKENLRSNVNHIVCGKRKMSREWTAEYNRNSNNVNIMIYRLFWILQYYLFYYGYHKKEIYRNPEKEKEKWTEYIVLSTNLRGKILKELKSQCQNFSDFLFEVTAADFNLLTLSRVLFELIYSHYIFQNKGALVKKLNRESEDIKSYAKQNYEETRTEYETYIDIYDKKTMDWLFVCQKYATHNFYAAYKLGCIYYSGETFYAGKNNKYEIEVDYLKAMEYYKMAIEQSNPPHPPACWAIGYMLCEDVYYGNMNMEEAYKKGMYYYDLAGSYAPAFNSKAKLLLKKTNSEKEKMEYEDVVKNYVDALCMAKKAADMGWLYGNNVIANFIIEANANNEKKLLKDIRKNLPFGDNFKTVYFLKKSAILGNPWGMYKLAVEYIETDRREEAEQLLRKACSVNFYEAYCILAIYFERGVKRRELLETAAGNGCEMAMYEMAMRYEEDLLEKKRKLEDALDKVLARHHVDILLFHKIMRALYSL